MRQMQDRRLLRGGGLSDPGSPGGRGMECGVGALVVFFLACVEVAGSPREDREQRASLRC